MAAYTRLALVEMSKDKEASIWLHLLKVRPTQKLVLDGSQNHNSFLFPSGILK